MLDPLFYLFPLDLKYLQDAYPPFGLNSEKSIRKSSNCLDSLRSEIDETTGSKKSSSSSSIAAWINENSDYSFDRDGFCDFDCEIFNSCSDPLSIVFSRNIHDALHSDIINRLYQRVKMKRNGAKFDFRNRNSINKGVHSSKKNLGIFLDSVDRY